MSFKIEKITLNELDRLCATKDAKILKYAKRFSRPKIFQLDEETIVKFFYPRTKKMLSSQWLKPHAMRFCDNIKKLARKGFTVPTVLNVQYCAELKVYLVYYKKIPGKDLRWLISQGNFSILQQFASFLATLHQRGIESRTLHLENIILTDDNTFALIDVVAVKFRKKALNFYLRYRNLRRLFNNNVDKNTLQTFGILKFMVTYFAEAKLSTLQKNLLSALIQHNFNLIDVQVF